MSARGWRHAALVRESLLNTVHRGSALWLLVVLAVLLGSGAAAFALVQHRAFEDLLESQNVQGRGVVMLGSGSADAVAEIERASCEGLAQRSDVLRSGIVLPLGRVDLPTLGADILVLGASERLLPALSAHEAVIGPALGADAGPTRMLLGGRPVDALVAGGGVPTSGMESAVTVGLAPEVRSGPHCLVELVPLARVRDVASELVLALRSDSRDLVAHHALQEPADLLDMHARRVVRFLPVVLGALGGVCALLVNWLRSSAFAAYRLSGTRRGEVFLLVVLEQSVVAGVFATSGVLAVVVTGGPPATGLWILIGALVWVATAPLSWLAAGRNPFRMAKDR